MALSSIDSVLRDKDDYCRYEPDNQVIRGRVLFTPSTGLSSETITIRLLRDRQHVVVEREITLNGDYPKGYAFEIDLRSNDCTITPKTGYRFHNARSGRYYLQVEQGSLSTYSEGFWILPLTPTQLRRTGLFGSTLASYDLLGPQEPLVDISGVRVLTCSSFIAKGRHRLIWDSSAKTLALDSSLTGGGVGQPVVISPGRRSYLIADDTIVSGEEYMVIDADYYEMPDGDVTEDVMIDNLTILDDYLRFYIREAYGTIQRDLQVPLEPTWVTTRWDDPNEWYQHYDPVALEQFNPGMDFIRIPLPVKHLLFLESLTGQINDGTVLTVPDDWRVEAGRSGLVSLVPQTAAALTFLQPGLGYFLLNRKGNVPAFWHFRALAGLPHLDEEFDPARRAVHYVAQISSLITAGSAYRGGYSSESVGRDGISASQSYTSSATFGIFSADIEEYRKVLTGWWAKFKTQIRGPRVAVI